jgi:hypothetical protein
LNASSNPLQGNNDDTATTRTTAVPLSNDNISDPTRRQVWKSVAAAVISSSVGWPTPAAHAGLLQFPCAQLKNRYHFMRAGLSELEADDIFASNALFLTNRENCLALDHREVEQALVLACQKMKDANQLPTVAYHSLAANGMDTADFMARQLLLARDRLLPEFTYLDPRGIGLWDGTSYETTRLAIMALDAAEAGPRGTGGRPPANTDGTPNETLADQFVRLRQFLSLQESRTSGENILVIFPDGTGPALASAMIAGLPLGSCHALEFAPGEIRLDVTQRSVLEWYNARKDDPTYLAMLEQGQEYLQALRKETSQAGTAFVNRKDRLAEERREALDQVYNEQQQRKKEAEQKRQDALLQTRRAEQQKIKEDRERRRQQERQQQSDQMTEGKSQSDSTNSALDSNSLDPLVLGGGLLASAGAAFVANMGNVMSPGTVASSNDEDETETSVPTNQSVEESASPVVSSIDLDIKPPLPPSEIPLSSADTSSDVENELESLEDAQERFRATILVPESNVMASSSNTMENTPSSVDNSIQAELNTLERGQTTMEEYMDFDDAWLRVMAEIRDEEDE